MQLLETEIRSGRDSVLVEFIGEGSEKVAVTMALSTALAPARSVLIGRAKQMMVQLTAFDVAENEYDQQSNGNFDEIVVSGSFGNSGTNSYIFEYRDAGSVRQIPGVDLPSLEASVRKRSDRRWTC